MTDYDSFNTGMRDDTANMRRAMIDGGVVARDKELNDRDAGPTWDTQSLVHEFEVKGFMAPFVVVRRKSDGKTGSLEFTHDPRVYFNFVED